MTAPLVFLTRDRAFWLAIGATAGTVYTTVFLADGNPLLIGVWLALNIAWGLVGSVFVAISVVRHRRARRAAQASPTDKQIPGDARGRP